MIPMENVPMGKTIRIAICLLAAAGSMAAATVSYKYDDTGRLISAAWDNGTTVAYSYDKAGNLLGLAVPTGTPKVNVGGIVNAASYTAPLVRGEVATIFGTNLSTGTLGATSVPLPTNLAGVQVTVGGMPAPLYYVSPGQLVFQVPFEVPLSGNTQLVVTQNGNIGSAQQVSTAEYAPAVFGYYRTSTVLDPVIVHPDNSLVSPASPASAGETVVLYATGAGSFDRPPATGAAGPVSPLANTQILATVTVAGAPVTVQFSGLVPSLVGALQINFILPSPLPAGSTLPVVVSFGSNAASPVNIYVQ
jgi:uncharacterized protein (TIGR03437 family)